MDKSFIGADSGLRNINWIPVFTKVTFVKHFGSITVCYKDVFSYSK